MRELTSESGSNAGKIWSALNEKGYLNKDDLLVITKLNEKEFHNGIGWLAREDKIKVKENNRYILK